MLKWIAPVALASFVMAVFGCGADQPVDQAAFSWQQPHAKVMPSGDLAWAPEPFVYTHGESVRYIDYEAGDDQAAGDSPTTAWKHHPWDANATGNAARASGVHTYVFKRGVVYRGQLVADESGSPEEPIRLTSAPGWGQGEAMIYGSDRIDGRWRRLDPDDAPEHMPEPEQVWYIDLELDDYPRAVWERRGDRIYRVHLARTPNWANGLNEPVANEDDVKSEWHEWQSTEKVQVDGQGRAWGVDPQHLRGMEDDALVGGTVWSEYGGVMGTPYPNPIEAYDPQRGAIRFGGPWGDASRYSPTRLNRYFLENLPRFLDEGGEYYYDGAPDAKQQTGRLYLRLVGDRNPNEANVEIASRVNAVQIQDRSHIELAGLTFRFGNSAHWYDRWWDMPLEDAGTVKVLGSCEGVTVRHCRFEHLPRPIMATTLESDDVMDHIAVTDNEMLHTDYGPIWMRREFPRDRSQAPGEFRQAEVLRNRIYHVGLRPMRSEHGHAVHVSFVSIAEVAGNMLDRVWGAGLFIFGGKPSGGQGEVPLGRILIHHNKVTDPLLNTNDWGGVESWQGGPTYIFNNVSNNPGGYWHWSHVQRGETADERSHTTARFGFAYYLDGAFKQYVFNNIAWGKENDLTSPLANTTGLQEIIGFQNSIFNNSFYRFAAGTRRQAAQNGRNYYLGNLWVDVTDMYFRHAPPRMRAADLNAADAAAAGDEGEPYDYSTMAFSSNVFAGPRPRDFGVFEHTGLLYQQKVQYEEALQEREALAADTGFMVDGQVLTDPANHDFRPADRRAVADRGTRHFVPWSLYGVVGEWHFLRHNDDPSLILSEDWYMTEHYRGRGMYRHIPRMDMSAINVAAEHFVDGRLEDWSDGALTFNGRDQYCILTNERATRDITYGETTIDGSDRPTVDMDENNFLIELYFKAKPGNRGTLVSKRTADTGYQLGLTDGGVARLWMGRGDDRLESKGRSRLDDGRWHHLLVEVDRQVRRVTIHVDGEVDAQAEKLDFSPRHSLSNEGDFEVGRGPEGDYFAGTIDFLRVSRGTLADARTTIEELYAWQFDGPFLRDFAGHAPRGKKRDAGALEAR